MEVVPNDLSSTSDYGSDFTPDEEEILNGLLQRLPVGSPSPLGLLLKDIEDDETPLGAKVPRIHDGSGLHQASSPSFQQDQSEEVGSTMRNLSDRDKIPVRVQFTKKKRDHIVSKMADDGDNTANAKRIVESPKSRAERETRAERSASIEAPVDIPPPNLTEPEEPDPRSPLERFRSKPQKALSVTDLVSPSWCEVQYWYTLTKHGRKRRTPAMRQGSAVHKTLEDEVHRTIAIDVKTKEDAWGLRIWNVIQGLRTLRATGMTRELEIWGIIDGLVVNGVIDELSYVCPDRELESTILSGKQDSTASLPPDQRTITEFLSPHGSSNLNAGNHGSRSQPQASESASLSGQRVYITDTKTRSSTSLPKGASLRPTIMQLMLYHRLLYNLSTGNIDPDTLFSRYQLDAHSPFTDAFAAQIGEIEDEVFYDAPDSTQSHDAESEPDAPAPRENQGDGLSLLLAHNSLHRLFFLLLSEFRTTFPLGTESISNILTASYRSTSDGEVIGQRTFLMDEKVLGEYLEEELRWWRGEREAKGVSVEEAYKCGYCEFAEGCDWRKGKVEEARERARLRGKRRKSVI